MQLPRADSFTKADLGNSYLREQALVGERLPLQKLIESCGRELARRLRELEPRFADWRSINGDGNCFYRSFLFLLLEGLLGDRRQARAVHRCASPPGHAHSCAADASSPLHIY